MMHIRDDNSVRRSSLVARVTGHGSRVTEKTGGAFTGDALRFVIVAVLLLLAAGAVSDTAQRPSHGSRFFSEIAGSIYAWDIADEGVERILGNLVFLTVFIVM